MGWAGGRGWAGRGGAPAEDAGGADRPDPARYFNRSVSRFAGTSVLILYFW